jgi:DNA-binding MarR family transcriptional regulator
MPPKNLEPAVTDLIQAISLLVRRVRAEGGSGDELSLPQAFVMKRLREEGPKTTADLARDEGMKPQSMGAIIAGLEEMRLVEKRPHPTDGRQMTIALTAKGAALLKRVGEAKRAWLAQAIAQLSEDEQAELFAAGKIIRRLVEK